MIKICQECGLEFEASNGMQKFCDRPHFRICKVCGNKFEVTRHHLTAKDAKVTCSKKCSTELRKQTNLFKYGGVAPACSKDVQQKMQNTTKDRFGVAHAAMSDSVKQKMLETSLSRYGSWYTQTEKSKLHMSELWNDSEYRKNTRERIEQTCLERYGGVTCFADLNTYEKSRKTYESKTGYRQAFSNPDVQSKIEETNLERYGVRRPLQNVSIREKVSLTNLERYGYKNPMQAKQIQDKASKTCLERYGNTCFLQSDLGKKLHFDSMKSKYGSIWFSETSEWKAARMKDPSKISNLMSFDSDPHRYIVNTFDHKPTLNELSDSIGTGTEAASLRLIRSGCKEDVAYVYSYMETTVYEFLRSLDNNLIIEQNTKSIISPNELDIYLPEYKIGIECNPTSTHNSSINTFDPSSDPLRYNYHLMKTKKCEDAGVFLFHIFGSEWTYSRPIIESMLRNLLGKNLRKIYARKCVVKDISSKICAEFLNANHRQGNANSPVRLGLYYRGELVSVMTFGKMRSTIGTDKTDLSDCWELVRFCSILNTSVVGGANKLFKHFVRSYNPSRIRSFSDRAHTRGTLYETLGFRKVRESDPGYVWVDSRTDISYHRYSAQKQNIKNFLHDDSIDLTKTEKEIMESYGFLQVFDCGTILWEYTNNL